MPFSTETSTGLAALAALVVLAGAVVPLLLGRVSLRAVEVVGAVAAVLLALRLATLLGGAVRGLSGLAFLAGQRGGIDTGPVVAAVAGLAAGLGAAWWAVPALATADDDGEPGDGGEPGHDEGAAADGESAQPDTAAEAPPRSRWHATEVLGDDDRDDEVRVSLALPAFTVPLTPRTLLFSLIALALAIENVALPVGNPGAFRTVGPVTLTSTVFAAVLLALAVVAPLLDGDTDPRDFAPATLGLALVGACVLLPTLTDVAHSEVVANVGGGLAAGLGVPLGLVAVVRLLRDVSVRTRVLAATVSVVALGLAAALGNYATADELISPFDDHVVEVPFDEFPFPPDGG